MHIILQCVVGPRLGVQMILIPSDSLRMCQPRPKTLLPDLDLDLDLESCH